MSDNGGGVVAAVEVSTDGGTTWRSATINSADQNITWTYTWVPEAEGNTTIKSRGVDDSGNIEVPADETNVTIGPDVCPCNIFAPGSLPVKPLDNDRQPIEIGVKFKATENGFINGIRYYKGTGTTGTHVGSLWTIAGVSLATATFTSETESGWQEVLFSTPVAITAGVTYVASAFSPSGDYASTPSYFTQAVVNGPLRGLADGEDGFNGVFVYANAPTFPTTEFKSINYWVDVVFTRTNGGTPPDITKQPVAAALCEGLTASFTSEAGGSPAPTVQWQSSLDGISWTDISGATSTTLSFVVNSADNNKIIRAVWTNAEGSVYSSPVVLTVTAPPVLTSDLAVTVNSGTALNYIPTSSGAGTVFTWSRAIVSGISNVGTNGSGNITETLINTTSSPVNVVYEYTLALNGCTVKENVVVTVNPLQSPGANCVITTSIKHHFNAKSIQAGHHIWFNSSFNPSGIYKWGKKDPVTILVTNSRISFTVYGKKYSLTVPDSRIRFAYDIRSASTKFVNNVWETNVPLSFSDDVFMGGLSYLVPTRLPRNIRNMTWTADVTIDKSGVSLDWKWGAAVYSKFAGNDGLDIKPVDGWRYNPYWNRDEAGTPENYKKYLVPGATGNRYGKDYTGHHSRSKKITCGKDDDDDHHGHGWPPIKWLNGQLSPFAGIKDSINSLKVIAGPNPSRSYFTLSVITKKSEPMTVTITDNFGKVMEKHERVNAAGALRFGDKLKTGLYFVEVMQGGERKTITVLKIN